MAVREIDPIGQAIIATEKEIAGEAWGNEEPVLDETGNRSNEEMGEGLEGQHEPDDDETEGEESEAESEEGEGEAGEETEGETEAAVQTAEKDKPADKPQVSIPPRRLREETERATAAEAERDRIKAESATREAEFNRQIAALTARIDAVARPAQQPAAQAETKPTTPPDFFEDPNGFIAHQTKPLLDQITSLQNNMAAQRVETSMALAHTKHGDSFAKAFEAVGKLNPQNQDDRVTVQRIYASPNPGEALVAWHKRNETLREVGDDPAKFKERIAAETRDALMKDPEFRKTLLEGLRAEASTGDNGRPNTTLRLPKSLNGAVGGNRRAAAEIDQFDGSDQGIAESAWRD